jgi:hypothetical protein
MTTKNTTLARKPSNDMKKNQGAYGINPRAKSTSQRGDGEDFAFNGQMGDGVNRKRESISCANPYTLGDKALSQNVGMGPRTGNTSSSSILGGKNPNMTMATASQGVNLGSGFKCPPVGNADKIYVGPGPRKGNE